MTTILPYIQIVIAVLLVICILLQQTEASAGAVFGGGDSASNWRTRRGFEKFLFFFTIALGILFAVTGILAL